MEAGRGLNEENTTKSRKGPMIRTTGNTCGSRRSRKTTGDGHKI